MSKINIRSPYFVNVTDYNLTSATLYLFVYTGTQGSGTTPVYTLNSTAYNDEVTFEISELVRDYLDITFNGTYDSQVVWVDYQIVKFISGTPDPISLRVELEGFDGYGYFEDGANPQNESIALQSNNIIYTNDFANIIIPIHVTGNTNVVYSKNGLPIVTKLLTSSTSANDRIQYVNNSALDSDFYYSRVIDDGGIVEGFSCLQEQIEDHYNYFDNEEVDSVTITGGGLTKTLPIEEIQECKYTPYKITFVNKFGALQDLWFFKRSNLSLDTKKETYKANIINSGSYSINEHQTKILNKKGIEKLVLNSGFYPEEYNKVFRQLMLSEKVWINYEAQTLPINILSSALNFKTDLNDKLINYTIDIDFAFDKINSVR